MLQIGHVHTNLMRATGLKGTAQQGATGKFSFNFIMGHGILAGFNDRHFDAIGRMTADRLIDITAMLQLAMHQRHLPATGYFFDTIIRQEPIDEDNLKVEDNLEEFAPFAESDVAHFREAAQAAAGKGKAVVATIGGTAFGDIALVPDPCYPPYRSSTIFAGGEVLKMSLLEKNHFLPI